MSDIVHRLRWWPTKVERLEAEPEPAFRLMLEAAEEIDRLRRIVWLWERCSRQTSEMYGGCVRPSVEAQAWPEGKVVAGSFAAGEETAVAKLSNSDI